MENIYHLELVFLLMFDYACIQFNFIKLLNGLQIAGS